MDQGTKLDFEKMKTTVVTGSAQGLGRVHFSVTRYRPEKKPLLALPYVSDNAVIETRHYGSSWVGEVVWISTKQATHVGVLSSLSRFRKALLLLLC